MRKIFICLLSAMLCLGVVFCQSEVKASSYTYTYNDSLDLIEKTDINVAAGSTINIDDYYYSYEFSLNDSYASIDSDGNLTGKKVGTTTLVLKYYDYDSSSEVTKNITVHVTDPTINKSAYNVYSCNSGLTRVSVSDMNQYSDVSIEYSTNVWIDECSLSGGYIDFYVYGDCSVNVTVDGKSFTLTFDYMEVSISASNTISKQIDSLVTYSGKSDTLTVKLDGKAKSISTWKSTNTKVATVSKGKVTGKGLGRCYIRAYLTSDDYVEYLVECTYKKAYQAVLNGFNDMLNGDSGKTIKYSQANRMKKGYRDCSSFVSRCYYDTTLNRKIFKIGDIKGNYASTAADQAKWLYSKGKTVANEWVSESKLLPGDTIYTSGGYNNGRWRNIYHATLYVGNGMVITTGSSSESGATLRLRYYDYNSNIEFIGRPLKTIKTTSISLNKTSITLGVKETFTLKATKKPTNSTQKISYKSSNSKVASVSSSGKITAKKKGTAYITVTSGSKSKKCKVVVKAAPKSIKLNAKSKTLKKKQTYQLKVTLSSGSASYKKTYKSSNTKVATVSSSGKITAKKKGKTTITVTTYNNKKATIKITVK